MTKTIESPSVVRHLEHHLGPILRGWDLEEDGDLPPVQIVEFDGGPALGAGVLTTLGLSTQPLSVLRGGRSLRQELVLIFGGEVGGAEHFAGVLGDVAVDAMISGRALCPGDVIAPRDPIVSGGTVSGFYVAQPACFPESFGSCRREDGSLVLFAWLIPITAREAEFVATHGSEALEDLIVDRQPDLQNFLRSDIV